MPDRGGLRSTSAAWSRWRWLAAAALFVALAASWSSSSRALAASARSFCAQYRADPEYRGDSCFDAYDGRFAVEVGPAAVQSARRVGVSLRRDVMAALGGSGGGRPRGPEQ